MQQSWRAAWCLPDRAAQRSPRCLRGDERGWRLRCARSRRESGCESYRYLRSGRAGESGEPGEAAHRRSHDGSQPRDGDGPSNTRPDRVSVLSEWSVIRRGSGTELAPRSRRSPPVHRSGIVAFRRSCTTGPAARIGVRIDLDGIALPLMAALRAGRNDTVSVVQRNRAADGVDAAPQYRSSRSTMP